MTDHFTQLFAPNMYCKKTYLLQLTIAKSKQEKELLPYIADYLHFKIFSLKQRRGKRRYT